MRIAMVHYFDPRDGGGGAERLFEDEVESMRCRGHEVRAFHFLRPDVQKTISDLHEYSPDVAHLGTLHVEDWELNIAKALLAGRVPCVWHLHDYWPFCAPRMLLSGTDKSCGAVDSQCDNSCGIAFSRPLQLAHGFHQNDDYLDVVNSTRVCVSNAATADMMRRHGVNVAGIVHLGVDTDRFCPPTEPRSSVSIYTSSAWASAATKGMHILRQAIHGKPYGATLLHKVPRTVVADKLRHAAIYVFPSTYQETWGLCLNEAMASGCACIASDVAGAKEQIIHGKNGLLFKNRDHAELATCIDTLMEDSDLRERLGHNARQACLEDFNLDAMAMRWEQQYLLAMK